MFETSVTVTEGTLLCLSPLILHVGRTLAAYFVNAFIFTEISVLVFCSIDHPVSTFTIPACNVLQTVHHLLMLTYVPCIFCELVTLSVNVESLYQHAVVSPVGVPIFILFIIFYLSFYKGFSYVS